MGASGSRRAAPGARTAHAPRQVSAAGHAHTQPGSPRWGAPVTCHLQSSVLGVVKVSFSKVFARYRLTSPQGAPVESEAWGWESPGLSVSPAQQRANSGPGSCLSINPESTFPGRHVCIVAFLIGHSYFKTHASICL